jgi:hypothetical protein
MKRVIIALFIAVFLCTPSRSEAQNVALVNTDLPFAGIVSYTLPCTCSGNLWIWFTPLYLGGPVVATGPMVYSPYSTILYAYYHIGVPALWHLGSYTPGVQACFQTTPAGCVPLPAIGLMTKVGTNRF